MKIWLDDVETKIEQIKDEKQRFGKAEQLKPVHLLWNAVADSMVAEEYAFEQMDELKRLLAQTQADYLEIARLNAIQAEQLRESAERINELGAQLKAINKQWQAR